MTRRRFFALLAALPLVLPAAGRALSEPTGPQPTLPREKLVIVTRDGAHHAFSVERATTVEQQMIGLMFRPSVPEDGGMLFDWGAERRSEMWMKNTLASLDMLFIGPDGTIRRIAENTVPQSLAVIDGGVARATLELAAGTAERLDIRVGDKVLAPEFGNAP
jgi:uncharacterized membrane protein (UPF0127 family)